MKFRALPLFLLLLIVLTVHSRAAVRIDVLRPVASQISSPAAR